MSSSYRGCCGHWGNRAKNKPTKNSRTGSQSWVPFSHLQGNGQPHVPTALRPDTTPCPLPGLVDHVLFLLHLVCTRLSFYLAAGKGGHEASAISVLAGTLQGT